MPIIHFIDGRLQAVIPLQVKPHAQQALATITGSAISSQAGTVLYGYYCMDYLLPGGDRLRMLANHNKNTVQLLLLTHDPEKLRNLPGERPSSLVANAINLVNRYRIRSDSYSQPRSQEQLTKYQLASTCIESLQQLLEQEQALTSDNWAGQEKLRGDLITILGKCSDENRLLANNPIISEGELGRILYDTCQFAQHYQFNRIHPVSIIDQLNFSQESSAKVKQSSCFVWDSELHIGQDEEALSDTLRVICQQYGLSPGSALSNIPANRFKRLELFLRKLWHNGQDWVNHLAVPNKPIQPSETEPQIGGLTITKIKPYYYLQGLAQIGYQQLDDLIAAAVVDTQFPRLHANSSQEAKHLLSTRANGSWVQLPGQQLILRLHNEMLTINYFEENGLFYPLPNGDDLATLSQLSKKHLYLPERVSLQLKAFFSRLPTLFIHLYRHLARFITHDLHEEFKRHVHANHVQVESIETPPSQKKSSVNLTSLQEILRNQGLLSNGQTLEEFVQTQIAKNHYVIVREMHPPNPPAYDNPLHRILGVMRHISAFFVDTSEKNPIIGTLALAAYAYGAGAVIAPETLTSLLNRLHLEGLIHGIKPTQEFGQWMSHGKTSEAISVATTYWEGIVVGGDLDQFFIQAVHVLKEDPAAVAIIVALAISLGYGLCQAIPALEEEMGYFPYINYAAFGAKGGAAIYDTVMHPGDDWLLGSIKWLLKSGLTLGKLLFGPLVESYYYGYRNGFLFSLKKSRALLTITGKQTLAALADLFLVIATIPLLEISALIIHVPFRGLTDLVSKTLATLGNWQALGGAFIDFATRSTSWYYLPGFRLSPLYGFHNPLGRYAQNHLANVSLNLIMLCVLPPLELIKNLAILPLFDTLSFSMRVTLSILNPISRLLAYTAGAILTTGGIIWDNSLGQIFQITAKGVTLSCNRVDGFAGRLKQGMLGQLQIFRRQIYHWAFSEEDLSLHKINSDKDYFLANPMRLENLPHDSTGCLLKTLLTTDKLSPLPNNVQDEPSHSHGSLFNSTPPTVVPTTTGTAETEYLSIL